MSRLLIENIIIPLSQGTDADSEALDAAEGIIRRRLGCEATGLSLHKKSIDARRRDNIRFVYSVSAVIDADADAISSLPGGMKLYTEPEFTFERGKERMNGRPVIVGFGPAGMFCAMALSATGYNPIVLERGSALDERVAAVESFYRNRSLDPNTNIQFGAGGAGTFSDGKLMTRINDPLCAYILLILAELGAPEDILNKAKPHIGTDILREVVRTADKKITSLGGEIRYNSRVVMNGERASVDGDEIQYGVLVLSPGHSARDLYSSLISDGYNIEPKAFSVGVRAEHLQADIDRAMFGRFAGDAMLGHAEYSLSMRRGGRGVYSFCMCPGGEVVAAASEEGGVVTNGMSRRARDGVNSNAALAVSVLPEDYGATPSDAIAFQRNLEIKAFREAGGAYAAPCQTVGDFLNGSSGGAPSKIMPTYMNGNVTMCDIGKILPSFVTDMLADGIRYFGTKIKGFDDASVPLTGVETRTSAPVRIVRSDEFTAVGHPNIYPCGEGAGYAGGIMSAAADGLRVARAIMEKYAPPQI